MAFAKQRIVSQFHICEDDMSNIKIQNESKKRDGFSENKNEEWQNCEFKRAIDNSTLNLAIYLFWSSRLLFILSTETLKSIESNIISINSSGSISRISS